MASAQDFLEWARTKQAGAPPSVPSSTPVGVTATIAIVASVSQVTPVAAVLESVVKQQPISSASVSLQKLAPEVAAPAEEKEKELLISQIQVLLEERNRLKLQVQDVVSPTPEFAINQMLFRAPFNLQPFRSLEDKRKLLHLAALSYDQNCVLSVVLFLRDTLGYNLFLQELGHEPIASAMYVTYLKESNDVPALRALYKAQGRYKQEAALMIQQAYKERRAEYRLEMFKECLAAVQGKEDLAFYKQSLFDQVSLLERQILIEQADTAEPLKADSAMVRVPRFSVLFTPVSTTTYYCLLYHSTAIKGRIASPLNLQSTFTIPERRMMWLTLRARARLGDWTAIKALVAPTGFFSSAPASAIGFEPFVEVLAQTGAPAEQLAYYAGLIPAPDRRAAVAEKYRIHNVAVEALIVLRHRARALKYSAKLREANFADHAAALERALSDTNLKWMP